MAAIAAAIVEHDDVAFVRIIQHILHDRFCRRRRYASWLAPIVRINACADEHITHVLGDGQHGNFVRGFGLVVNPVRRTEQQRFHPQRAFNQPLGNVQLHPDQPLR